MSDWKKACINRIENNLVYMQVEGVSGELRKSKGEFRFSPGIEVKPGSEIEVTIKNTEKGLRIDEFRRITQTVASNTTLPSEKSGASHAQPHSSPALGIHLPLNNPYTFLPIDLNSVVKASPVWHDGSETDQATYSGELCCTLTALTPLLVGNQRFKVSQARDLPGPDIHPEKGILEPLRLADGRVVLPGSSLKGMIRNSLAALFNAPMERVKEHHYTYRPNLDFNKVPEKYATRPAIVTSKNGKVWQVNVLPDARSATFRPNEKPTDARRFSYRGGIDGAGLLAGAHAQANNRRGGAYKEAFVSAAVIKKGQVLDIPEDVYKAYEQTQSVLSDDTHGHLAAHPLSAQMNVAHTSATIEASTPIAIDQLIYVEVELRNKQPYKIVSMGHHFRYRWAYRDSIKNVNAIAGKQHSTLRPELDVPAQESDGQLTAANAMFGYAGDARRLGDADIDKLAGRIAINHALSENNPQFINPDKNHWVFLKILGQPKASAVEHYLKQPGGSHLMQTYGDLPGNNDGGQLAGRKFYRHQPAATGTASCYEMNDTDTEGKKTNQATLARFISAPDSTFRFTVRFARLRAWEFGALIAALNPHRLDANAKADDYALKLGYGRPLGLGSIRINIDAMVINGHPVSEAEEQLGRYVDALRPRIAPVTLKDWLTVQRWQRQGQTIDYPGQGAGTERIYTHHTAIRKEYSKLRRQEKPAPDSVKQLNNKISGR